MIRGVGMGVGPWRTLLGSDLSRYITELSVLRPETRVHVGVRTCLAGNCCGGAPINTATEVCCGDTVVLRGFCCNNKPYNPPEEVRTTVPAFSRHSTRRGAMFVHVPQTLLECLQCFASCIRE